MADTLHKKQQNLYYFQKDSGLELEFLVRMKGECVPLEVKAKTAQAKSARTVLKHTAKYQVKHIIKFGDYNVGRECSGERNHEQTMITGDRREAKCPGKIRYLRTYL